MKFRYITIGLLSILCLAFFVNALKIQADKLNMSYKNTLPEKIMEINASSETNLNEEFSLRYYMYETRSLFYKATGRRYIDSLYKLDNGHLVTNYIERDSAKSLEELKKLKDLCDSKGMELLYVNIPTQLQNDDDLEIIGISSYSNSNADKLLGGMREENIDYLDMRSVLAERYEDTYDAFFKTDHHWKISTGLYCAQVVAQKLNEDYDMKLNLDAVSDDSFTVINLENCWFGETGRRTGSVFSGREDFELIKPKIPTRFHLEMPDLDIYRTGDFSIMLQGRKLNGNTLRWYYQNSCYYEYLIAGTSFVSITNLDRENGNILLIRDSFANSIAPFLAMSAAKVVCWDVRYSNESLAEYINSNDFDAVVILYTETMIDGTYNGRYVFDFS